MRPIRFGIVGTGMIAHVVANAMSLAADVQLHAVVSRNRRKADAFSEECGAAVAYGDWRALVADENIDVIYVATPTAGREEICLAAIANGKHLISEKPFLNGDSAQRIADAAQRQGVAFMDATHFSHHPRTEVVHQRIADHLGKAKSVSTSFFFPFTDRSNIRFDPQSEPTGAIGDMAWYNMRAIVEYLQPQGAPHLVAGAVSRDPQTGAVVRGTGLMTFADGKSSTFNFGYDSGVCQMDLDILGESGLIQLNDYVLDWKDGFAFNNPTHTAQFVERHAMNEPADFQHLSVNSEKPQAALMIEAFVRLLRQRAPGELAAASNRAIQTQLLLDAFIAKAL